MDDKSLHIKIVTPSQTLFEGQAESISSKNSSGKFDILPEHANFITVIENEPIIIRQKPNSEQKFTFPLAILYNNRNQVKIYTDLEDLPELT